MFLIFELDGIPRYVYDNDTLRPKQTFSGAWISGMQTRYLTISAHEHSEMFVVQFAPEGAHAFLHADMQRLKDAVVPAETVVGSEVLELRNEMLRRDTPEGKFALVDQWLRRRFDEQRYPPAPLTTALRRLEAEPAANLGDIVAGYPHFHRHLIEQFKKKIGLTPKVYQRIMRFNEVLQAIHKRERITWAQIAYTCGYSDQSHFIKEFKRFCGFNPRDFIDRGHHEQEPNFFPLDD